MYTDFYIGVKYCSLYQKKRMINLMPNQNSDQLSSIDKWGEKSQLESIVVLQEIHFRDEQGLIQITVYDNLSML